MSLLEACSLTLVMLTLAAIPSASVLLVVTRAASLGTRNGAAVAGGIVLADLLFVALAIMGMSALAEQLGSFFAVIKIAGGAYLIWMGFGLLRSQSRPEIPAETRKGSTLAASFASGFLLTLGDLKAILFYAALFPTVVDMSRITSTEIGSIVGITILTVGGVKMAYACAARRIAAKMNPRSSRKMRTASGCLLMGAGTYLIAKS